MQEKIRTLHVYLEEEEPPIVDDMPEQDAPNRKTLLLPLICLSLVTLLCIGIPATAILLSYAYPDTYDATISRTLTLTLSQHPLHGQLSLYALPTIRQTQHITVSASGNIHQDATRATGFITFYNGLFTPQTVPAGTTLTGKSGVEIATTQPANIPAAIATTPPTYGTISVSAVSRVPGATGNIAASDIDRTCCGASILAQNLYAFSGGQDAKDLPELTKSDISTGTQTLTAQVNAAVRSQANKEARPGDVLLPLDCNSSLSSDHQAGDEAASAVITLTQVCTPLAYFAPDIETIAQRSIPIPKGYQFVSFVAFVAQSHLHAQGGTLTIQAIVYLKRMPRISTYRFAGE